MPNKTIDAKILTAIHLSDPEVRDMEEKYWDFAKNLSPDQQHSLHLSMPTSEEAAATLKSEITAGQLEQFIRDRAPQGATSLFVNFGGGKRHGKPTP
jgi:hypothetical protein